MRRYILKLALCTFIVLSAAELQTSNAQGVGETIVALKQVRDAAKIMNLHWDKIKWFFGGMKHTWWACVYRDGFTTYNNPRSYRKPGVVLNYFMGYDGDCDAFYYYNGGRYNLCYDSPHFAQRYAQQHGPIVDLLYQDGNGNWNSVLNSR